MIDVVAGNCEAAESNAKGQCYDGFEFGRCMRQNDKEKCFHSEATTIEHLPEMGILIMARFRLENLFVDCAQIYVVT